MSPGEAGGSELAADWVRRRLGYQPLGAALFEQALTHRSAARSNNERLEYLGDAVLELLAKPACRSAVRGPFVEHMADMRGQRYIGEKVLSKESFALVNVRVR